MIDCLAMFFQNIDFLQRKQHVFKPESLQLITYQQGCQKVWKSEGGGT